MSTDKPKPRSENTELTEPKPRRGDILIDYRGTVGASDGQEEVSHIRSPLILPTPINGELSIVLHPGLNVLRRELTEAQIARKQKHSDAVRWERFMSAKDEYGDRIAEAIQAEEMINAGCITELSAKDIEGRQVTDLIARTLDLDALAWLEERVKDRQNATSLLTSITARRELSRVNCKPIAFQQNIPGFKKMAQQEQVARSA